MDARGRNVKAAGKHVWLMVLCCLIPLTAFLVLWKIGFSGSFVAVGLMLLCPVLHLVMMRGMGGDRGGGGHTHCLLTFSRCNA